MATKRFQPIKLNKIESQNDSIIDINFRLLSQSVAQVQDFIDAFSSPVGGDAPSPSFGSGTTGYIPRWASPTLLADSLISQSGSNVYIGANLSVTGVTTLSSRLVFGSSTYFSGLAQAYTHATDGLVIAGFAGTSADLNLVNRSGSVYMRGEPNSQAVTFPGHVRAESNINLSNALSTAIQQIGGGYLVLATSANNIYLDPADDLFIRPGGGYLAVRVLEVPNSDRYITMAGSVGGNPTIGVSAGSLAITPNVAVAGNININGATNATSHGVHVLNKSISSSSGSLYSFGAGDASSASNSEFIRLTHTGTLGELSVSRTTGGAFRDFVLYTSDTERLRISAAGATTLSKTLQVNEAVTVGTNTVGAAIQINGAAADTRALYWNRAGVTRWGAQATSTSEDWALNAYNAVGALIDSPINVVNAAGGAMALSRPVTMASTLGVTGAATLSNLAGSGTRLVTANASGVLGATTSSAFGLVDGTGAANRVAYWSDADTITSSANFTFNGTDAGIGGGLAVTGGISGNYITVTNAVSGGSLAITGGVQFDSINSGGSGRYKLLTTDFIGTIGAQNTIYGNYSFSYSNPGLDNILKVANTSASASSRAILDIETASGGGNAFARFYNGYNYFSLGVLTGTPGAFRIVGDSNIASPGVLLQYTNASGWTTDTVAFTIGGAATCASTLAVYDVATFRGDGIGTTSTTRAILSNSTAAAAAAQQYSPALQFSGRGWKTNAVAASQSVDFRTYLIPIQGAANPTSALVVESSVNGGAYAEVARFGSGLNFHLPGTNALYFGGTNASSFEASISYNTGDGGYLSVSGTTLIVAENMVVYGTATFSLPINASGGIDLGGTTTFNYYQEGTFTATGTGFSGSVTVTARYTRVGNIVTLYFPDLSGTSNATTFTITGIPGDITPARKQWVTVPDVLDNGLNQYAGTLEVNVDSTIGVWRRTSTTFNSSSWTASGTKALLSCTVTYTVQ